MQHFLAMLVAWLEQYNFSQLVGPALQFKLKYYNCSMDYCEMLKCSWSIDNI